jgi:hypothetical protein
MSSGFRYAENVRRGHEVKVVRPGNQGWEWHKVTDERCIYEPDIHELLFTYGDAHFTKQFGCHDIVEVRNG